MRRVKPWMIWAGTATGAALTAGAAYAISSLLGSSWPSEGDSCSFQIYQEILGEVLNDAELERAWRYMPLARHAAHANGIDPTLLAAVVHSESRWNPNAQSSVAAGLTQHVASTAAATFKRLAEQNRWPFTQLSSSNDPQRNGKLADLGVAQWVDRTDPQQSLWLGAGTLSSLLGKGNGEHWALAAYNGGAGNAGESGPQGYADAVLKRRQRYDDLERRCRGVFA